MVQKTKNLREYLKNRRVNLGLAAVAALLVLIIGPRAIDTGSLQQYGLVLVLAVLAVNRLIHAISGK